MRNSRSWLVAGVFLLLGFAVYGSTLGGSFLNWDDNEYVTGNPELRLPFGEAVASIFTTPLTANYNPVQRLVYLYLFKACGPSAGAFRTASLLLHVLAAFLLYLLLSEWLSHPGAAFAAAAVFLVHPANVEIAAWVSESKTLLGAVFAFAACLAYLKGARGRRWGTPVALLLTVLALLSKLSVAGLPVLFVLLDLSVRRKVSIPRILLFLPPVVVIGLAQVSAASGAGAIRPLHGGTLATHVLTVVGLLPAYLRSFLWPGALLPKHTFAPLTSPLDPAFLAGVLLLAVGAWGAWRSWRGERRFLVAAAWFLLALLPSIAVPIPILLADRYLYLAMPLLLGVGAHALLARPGAWPGPAAAAAVVVLAFFAGSYARVWTDSVRLWETVTARSPKDATAWLNLGAARVEQGRLARGIEAYRRAVALDPGSPGAREGLGLALSYAEQGPEAEAILLALTEDHPEMGSAWSYLGILRARRGDEAGAEAAFAAGLRNDRGSAVLWKNLGNFRRSQGRDAEAFRAFQEVIRLTPEDREALAAMIEISRPR